MPIRINLLTEAIAEENLRRRDPVKRAIYLGGFLIVLSLVWLSSSWLKYKMTQNTFDRVEGEIQMHTNAYAQVQANLKVIGEDKRRLAALAELSKSRLLKGDLLNALQKIYVKNVQLVRVRLDQSYVQHAGVPAKSNGEGSTPARPGTSTQKTLLTLDAKDYSANPGDMVNHYKDALVSSPYFSSILDTNSGIRLANLSPSQSSGDGKSFVLFTLECKFSDITR